MYEELFLYYFKLLRILDHIKKLLLIGNNRSYANFDLCFQGTIGKRYLSFYDHYQSSGNNEAGTYSGF